MFSTISAKVKAKQIEVSQLCVQLQPSLESLPIPLLARPANASSRPEPSDYKSWNQRKSDGLVKVRTVQVLDGDLAIGDLALAQFRWRSSTWRSSTCTVLTCTRSPVLDLQFCSKRRQPGTKFKVKQNESFYVSLLTGSVPLGMAKRLLRVRATIWKWKYFVRGTSIPFSHLATIYID